MPGPRKLFFEERFALSYDALKMKGTSRRVVISLSLPGDFLRQGLTLDHAGTGDEEQRPVDADLEIGELHGFEASERSGEGYTARRAGCRPF